jgi:glycosyltransferase involved in cell wall biosynthesis
MGAVNFSLDEGLVKKIKTILPLDIFVETGTFKGDTIECIKNYFKEIHSVELSEVYYEFSKERFKDNHSIKLYLDNSPDFLEKLRQSFSKKSVLYWLDAHWCVADKTAGEKSQCPLLQEINAIRKLNDKSIIIIDDARLFISPPPKPHEISHWPSFESLLEALKKLSDKHELIILNDTIIFYPTSLKETMHDYAYNNSIDWLHVLHKTRDYDNLRNQFDGLQAQSKGLLKQLNEKDNTIFSLSDGLKDREEKLHSQLEELKEKDKEVFSLSTELKDREEKLHSQLEELKEKDQKIFSLLNDLEEKEKMIFTLLDDIKIKELSLNFNEKEEKIILLSQELEEKEKQIAFLSRSLNILKKRLSTPIWGLLTLFQHHFPAIWEYIYQTKNNFGKKGQKKNKKELKFLEPRLGKLYQYEPKEIKTPKAYVETKLKTNPLKISITTPSFNQGEFLRKTIDSIVNQSYNNLEYVIQDSCSTDETKDIFNNFSHKDIRCFIEKDKGQADAINRGFAKSSGEIMAWINSDDVFMPGTFNYVVNYFSKHPKVDVVYGHRILIDTNDKEIGRWILPRHDKKVLYYADFIPQETLFWRRKIWEKIGASVNDEFDFAIDWELLLRFQQEGAKIVRLPRFLAAFRVHSQQKTFAQISTLGEKEMNNLRRKYLGKDVEYSEIKRNIQLYLIKSELLTKLYSSKLLRY